MGSIRHFFGQVRVSLTNGAGCTTLLTFDGRVRPGRLLPPLGDEDGDGAVAAHLEPPHADPDPQAGEHLLVAVAHRHVAPVDHDRQQRVHLGRVFGGGHHCNQRYTELTGN